MCLRLSPLGLPWLEPAAPSPLPPRWPVLACSGAGALLSAAVHCNRGVTRPRELQTSLSGAGGCLNLNAPGPVIGLLGGADVSQGSSDVDRILTHSSDVFSPWIEQTSI